MKTVTELNRLIQIEADAIEALDNEKRGGATREAWAARQKVIRKERSKRTDRIAHLRRLILFVERSSEEGVRLIYDRLQKEVTNATATAHRMFDEKSNSKAMIREYLTTAGVLLKKKQIKELEFLLK